MPARFIEPCLPSPRRAVLRLMKGVNTVNHAASEAMTPEYLAKPLTPFPLPTTDGWMLRTIGDTGAYILALPKKRKRLPHWEQARRLIMKEAGVATVTQQVRHALSKDDKLDVFAFESITSARRWRGAHKLEEE
jgi:hypothetical protein